MAFDTGAGAVLISEKGRLPAMGAKPMLSGRESTILKLLVDEYVQTATPVASDGIARSPALRVSPATVRSAMSQLTEEGYISRPHISAGGVPSDLGYRHYVESLEPPPSLPARLRQRVDRWLGQGAPDAEAWTRRCAAALSQLTANLAIVTQPRAAAPRLKRLQLVFLHECIALLVIVLGETRLLKRTLPLADPVSQQRLDQAAERLNRALSGLNRQQIMQRTMDLDGLERRVRQDSLELMQEAEQSDRPEHRVEGLGRLLHQPEFAAGERARQLVQTVEDGALLARALSAARQPWPQVYIGSENRQEALRGFGVIVCRYGTPDGVGGAICVVGPTRMGYATAIAGTRHLAAVMGRMAGALEGGDRAD